MFRSSYIPPRSIRELRELTRTHRKLIEERTANKNRIHKLLVRNGIRLLGVFSDIFEKSGLIIINGLIEGKPIEQILRTIQNPRILKKKDDIESAICGELCESDIFVIRQSLESIRHHNIQIAYYEEEILRNLSGNQESPKILMSIPGVGLTIGSAIIAEIGDIAMFESPKQLVSWAGLAPAVYESAGKTAHGHITKRGTKYLRTMLIEAAQTIARGKSNRLKQFFTRIRARKGYKKAIVALAWKLLTIIHHFLSKHEMYTESPNKVKKVKLPEFGKIPKVDQGEIIQILTRAGYIIRKSNSE